MSLMNCPDCEAEISTEAFICPKCGRPTGRKPKVKWVKILLIWFALVVAFMLIYNAFLIK